MSLERYQRKRDFTATPEPPGAASGDPPRVPSVEPGATSSGEPPPDLRIEDGATQDGRTPPPPGRRFVVQRHRARRLHYDFRLEVDGVLASWAVPRGPTLDPTARRMAVQVEDHPLEYFSFEGVIPERQYGAGDVIVWDWGTYEPEATDDPAAALRSGELKFRLIGEKLGGRFTLVRTRSRDTGATAAEEANWLLIKKRDERSVPGWDPESHPRSVKSGRTNDEVVVGTPDPSTAARRRVAGADLIRSGAHPAPMPDFVPPMLATPSSQPFSDPDWLYEVKWDGYRVQALVREGSLRLWTRNRQDAAAYFPALAVAPDWLDAREAILDGEVVALRPDGSADFGLLQALTGLGTRTGRRGRGSRGDVATGRAAPAHAPAPAPALAYEVFDLLYLDGHSLLDVPLEERKRLLKSILRPHALVRYAGHVEAEGRAFFAACAERGVEGMVAKFRRSRYEPGRRSDAWRKVKVRQVQEVVVVGYVPGTGHARDLGALVVGVYDDDRLRFAGRVGSGFDDATRHALLARLGELRRSDPPVADAPPIAEVRWVEPRLVARVEFADWTADGLLRQPVYKGLEIDRDAHTVHRERLPGRPLEVDDVPAMRGPGAEAARPGADEAGPGAKEPGPPARTADDPAVDLAALERLPAPGGRWTIGGRELRLTNLDRLLFPAAGLTKRDLVGYYASVAPVLLPYFAGRACNLTRWPDGVDGPHFWQQALPAGAPAWIARRRLTVHDERESRTYLVADEVATFPWLGNQAAIELHPWTSLVDAPDEPTYALIDIDPGERTAWDEVLLLARLYRDALAHLHVRGYPKTTGKRGIQVWVPVRPGYTFDATRAWVEALSRAVGAVVPELVSWEWEKAARRGLARLDYTQNARRKTLVGPYVVRATPNASVSTPITWDELDDARLRPDRWTIRSIGERLAERGDLFRGALDRDQELPPL